MIRSNETYSPAARPWQKSANELTGFFQQLGDHFITLNLVDSSNDVFDFKFSKDQQKIDFTIKKSTQKPFIFFAENATAAVGNKVNCQAKWHIHLPPQIQVTIVIVNQTMMEDGQKEFHLFLEKDSSLTYMLWDLGQQQNYLHQFSLMENAQLKCFNLTTHDCEKSLKIDLKGEGAKADLFGLTLTRSHERSNLKTIINHLKPQTFSSQLFKNVLWDESKASFQGSVAVAKGASESHSEQLNKSLMMGDRCKMISEPILLIDNNDVKCTHGATIGQLDEDQIFYLQSRGIPVQRAQTMMAHGFALDIFMSLENAQIKEACHFLTNHYLALKGNTISW
jgi:Fe-S cluster assembly scaffold protein SufB